MRITLEKRKEALDFIADLYRECWKDKNFINELKDDPVNSVKDRLGRSLNLQEGKKNIVVEDQTNSNIIYLNIPSKVSSDDFELTEEELEMVSGGALCGGACVVGIIFVASVVIGFFAEGDGK